MTPEMFVELFRDALWMVLIMVCAIIIPSLLIGLVVAIFQAATYRRANQAIPRGGFYTSLSNLRLRCRT